MVEAPRLLKHMTMAIYHDGGLSGGARERFRKALDIARSRLVEYGFAHRGGEEGALEDFRLTPKGGKRERRHQRESGGHRKNWDFDRLYEMIQVAYEQKSSEGKPAFGDREEREVQQEADRLASKGKRR